MTLIGALIVILFIVCLGSIAYWIIMKFIPEPARMIALAVVGVVLLIVLFGAFLPEVGGYRLYGR